MISDTPPSYYEYTIPDQQLHKRAIYNMLVLPWNITIIDLYVYCKHKPEDASMVKILSNTCDIRQRLVELYNFQDIDDKFELMMDTQGIHDFLTFE